jgi:hypothetical protein
MAVGDTPTYTPSPPTIGPQTEDGRNIVDWVSRELHNISTNLSAQTRLQITPVSAPPPTPREGLLAYADGVSWNPNSSGKGIAIYDPAISAWRQFPQLQVQTIGDANYNIRPQDELIVITGFTAPRTWTLPPPNTFAGRELIITGIPGSLSSTNTLTIQHNAAEFIDQPQFGLSGTTAVINSPMPYVRITSDGSNWFLVQILPNASDPIFGASGGGHSAGDVPDPGAVAGTTHFLREDATWAVPPAPAQTLTLLNTLVFSASAGVTDTTSFTSTYDNYLLIFQGMLPSVAGATLRSQISVGGVFQTTSYVWNTVGFFAANAAAIAQNTADTSIPCFPPAVGASNTGGGLNGELRVYNINQTTSPKLLRYDISDDGANTGRGFTTGAWRGGNGALSGIFIFPSSGTVTGKVKVYGIS